MPEEMWKQQYRDAVRPGMDADTIRFITWCDECDGWITECDCDKKGLVALPLEGMER